VEEEVIVARTVRDAKLETRAARDRLKPGPDVHWRTVVPKQLHLGYRRRRKGKPGVWIVRHYLGLDAGSVGRYRKETIGIADDFEDADGQAVLSYADAQRLALADRPGAPRGSLTVKEAIANYVSWLRVHRSSEAAAGVQRRAALHILPKLGAVPVQALTTDQLNRWRDALAQAPALLRTGAGRATRNCKEPPKTPDEKRARKATANKSVTVLRAALTHAFNSDLVDDDKTWRRFKPFKEVGGARERFLSLEEAQRLINAADRDSGFRDLVHAALLTGMRYAEICRLKVKDYADGKVAVWVSKTGKPRHVRLTEEGRTFFSQLTAGRDPKEIMLPHRGREWRKSEQARPMKEACLNARIEPLGFHALRHTWASLSVMNGVPLLVVANNLGHTTTRMVEAHYGHLTASYMDQAIAEGAPRFGAVETTNVTAMRGK
jgi:integrase